MPGFIGKYKITRTLGQGGSCKVKLGEDEDSKRKFAIKIMNPDMDEEAKQLVLTEVSALQELGSHPNIVQIHECNQGKYEKGGKSKVVDYIVLDLCKGGELFDFIAVSGRFEEPLARYFFKQFMNGLDHCHRRGIAHRDLKPDNLLLDKNFSLKIADFGFAAPVEGRDGSGYLTTGLGTFNYMAPEIHNKQAYQGRSIDLFASAIILFIMVAQHPPFTAARSDDPYYKCIAQNRADWFWKLCCNGKEEGEAFFSEDFKDLIQSMIQLNPSHRPSMSEVMNHPWMQGDTPTDTEVKEQFKKRQSHLKQNMADEREQKNSEKAKRMSMRKEAAVMRGEEEEDVEKPQKEMDEYEKLFVHNTEFFTTYNPDIIEEVLLKFLDSKDSSELQNLKTKKDKYKINFTLSTQGQSQATKTDICVRILKVEQEDVKENQKYAVEFQKLKGDQHSFHTIYNDILTNVLDSYNDSLCDAPIVVDDN